jgi:hypothetical protein
MALGATTYKTPNIIFSINSDLTDKEGCGVYLDGANTLTVASLTTDVPYGIVVAGCNSLDDGSKVVAASALELVDQLGCTVQVTIGSTYSVYAGFFLLIDSNDANGTFVSTDFQPAQEGDWIWGLALTNAGPGEQCLMRFQPFVIQYIAPPPP